MRARFSALQRAEIAEIRSCVGEIARSNGFSALQRAEIAEIPIPTPDNRNRTQVSVLFNEPKLLKYVMPSYSSLSLQRFSALQRAEIAEIVVCVEIERRGGGVSVLFNEPKLLK